MYHRVATPVTDVWELAVSPEHFKEQLNVLQKMGTVLPIAQMVEDIKKGQIRNKTIAITFDDGYVDNLDVALPMLEAFDLPATIFLTSKTRGSFWWDELEKGLLTTRQLPQTVQIPFDDVTETFDLASEAELDETTMQAHKSWKAMSQPPPTRRATLYLQVWQKLRSLRPEAQAAFLEKFWQMNGVKMPPANDIATEEQLELLIDHPLITIGGHTANHPALAMHPIDFQMAQMQTNKQQLESFLGKPVTVFSYPFGNHNQESMKSASSYFDAAFTTQPETINKRSNRHQLGRFQVLNWNGADFKAELNNWLRNQ